MTDLPFQAKMTDRLATMLKRIMARCQRDGSDALPSIAWRQFDTGPRAGTWNWLLESYSRKWMKADDIFPFDDFSVHIAANDQRRLAHQILDWVETKGVVANESDNLLRG
jgi:hypothetical protein